MRLIATFTALLLLSGCSSIASNMAHNLSGAMMDENDPVLVRDGAPAYLLMIDGFIKGDPDNEDMLLAGAKLYGSYAGAFVQDPARARKLSSKSFDYSRRALCEEDEDLCAALGQPYEIFEKALQEADDDDMAFIYQHAVSWTGWIQTHSDNWNAIADLAKVKALMQFVVEHNESFEDGGAHIYLGVMETLLPPAMGGKPELAKEHFDKALAISKGQNLMVKVLYAKHYARLLFDRELHDKLLNEVVASDAKIEGYTLINTLAQEQAKTLLASADDYF